MKNSLPARSGAKSEAFSFAFPLISQPPAAIPLVKASFFVIAPLDIVRREHELEIALIAGLVHYVIVLEPE